MDRDSITLHVMGKTRTGKSYWVKNTLLPELRKHKPVIVFDRKAEYAGKYAKDIPKGENWLKFVSIFHFFDEVKQMEYKLEKKVYVITCTDDRDYTEGVHFFNELQKHKKPITLVFEEASDLLKSPDFSETKRRFIKMARHGSHDRLGLVLISQRTLDVPTDIRSQLTAKISFHQAYNGDIEAIEKEGYPEAKEILDLKPREYLKFGEFPKRLSKITKGAKNE